MRLSLTIDLSREQIEALESIARNEAETINAIVRGMVLDGLGRDLLKPLARDPLLGALCAAHPERRPA